MMHDAHVTAWLRHFFRYDHDAGLLYWTSANKIEANKVAGTVNPNRHKAVKMGLKRRLVHRIAWQVVHGYEPEIIDHIDGDFTNNSISNLRECTPVENAYNTLLGKRNKLGAKGVRKSDGRFDALIVANKKQIYLGRFETLDEAAHAYNKAAIRMHGEFAKLNPIGVDKQYQEPA